MRISEQDGRVDFDNLSIHKGLTRQQLTTYEKVAKVTLQIPGERSAIYSLLYGWSGNTPFAMSLIFKGEIVEIISIGVGHPDQTWDDETEEQIISDGRILYEYLVNLWGSRQTDYFFSWGKLEFTQDVKNGGIFEIVLTYN